MTFTADRFFCLNVAAPTSRAVPLSSSRVDLQNVRPRLVGGHFNRPVTSVARRLLQVRSVLEVIKTERRPERLAVAHRVGLLCVTDSAGGELIIWLMNVTGIALRMLRHAGLQARLIKMMAEVTFGCALGHLVGIHLPSHLLRVRVIAMRETLEPELYKLRRKRDSRPLRVNRGLMADDAHLAFQICLVFNVTFLASRMSWEQRLGIIARPHVAGGAVLRFGLVLFAIVIERRENFDHLRIHDIEWCLAYRGRGRWVLNRSVQVLLRASTCTKAGEQDERRNNYSL